MCKEVTGETEANRAQILGKEQVQEVVMCMLGARHHGKGYLPPWRTWVTSRERLHMTWTLRGWEGSDSWEEKEGISGGGDHRTRGA